MKNPVNRALLISLVVPFAAVVACGSSSNTPNAGDGSAGPVPGPADTHCGAKTQATSQAACHLAPPDGGTADDGGEAADDYGAPLNNAEGDDDDCKYHVKFSVSGVKQAADVFFTVTATNKADGKATTGADITPEVFLSDTHPAPDTMPKAVESAPGTYKVGPIHFDLPGQWTVRFHLFEECTDFDEETPHGHVAFFVNVP